MIGYHSNMWNVSCAMLRDYWMDTSKQRNWEIILWLLFGLYFYCLTSYDGIFDWTTTTWKNRWTATRPIAIMLNWFCKFDWLWFAYRDDFKGFLLEDLRISERVFVTVTWWKLTLDFETSRCIVMRSATY